MERRSFLALVGAGVIGAGMDLESFDLTKVDTDRLLWVPGKKKIFLPPPPQELFHSIADCTREVTKLLAKELNARGQRGLEVVVKPDGFKIGEPGRVLQANLPAGYGRNYIPHYTKQVFTDQIWHTMEVPQERKRFRQEYDVCQDRFVPCMVGDAAPTPRRALRAAAVDLANQIAAGDRNGRSFSMMGTLVLPQGVEGAAQIVWPEKGISVRGVRAFDIGSQQMMQRFDIIAG